MKIEEALWLMYIREDQNWVSTLYAFLFHRELHWSPHQLPKVIDFLKKFLQFVLIIRTSPKDWCNETNFVVHAKILMYSFFCPVIVLFCWVLFTFSLSLPIFLDFLSSTLLFATNLSTISFFGYVQDVLHRIVSHYFLDIMYILQYFGP